MSSSKAVAANVLHVLVTVDDGHRGDLNGMAKHLEAVGLNVADCFPMSGIIAGQVAECDIGKLRAVKGIAAVEEEPSFGTR